MVFYIEREGNAGADTSLHFNPKYETMDGWSYPHIVYCSILQLCIIMSTLF